MKIAIDLISGVMLGIENIEDLEEGYSYWVIDLFIFRIMFIKEIN